MRFPASLLLLSASAALVLADVGVVAQQAPAAGQRWAVLVGVNEYAELEDLRYCVADVRALRDRLVASGFPEQNVFLLVDDAPRQVDRPFRANIQQRIETVLKVAREDDLVVVAFSGHGLHIGGTSYFCPADASLDSPETTMVPVDFVYRQLEASTARQKLLLVDACRNDPRPPGSKDAAAHQRGLELLGKQLQEDRLPKRVAALSSAAPGQFSWEDDKLGHGVFMHYVLEGLSGKADEAGNRDGVVLEPDGRLGGRAGGRLQRRREG